MSHLSPHLKVARMLEQPSGNHDIAQYAQKLLTDVLDGTAKE